MVLLAFTYIPLGSSYSLLLCTLLPIKIYENVYAHKAQILKENKGKSGIYLWRNLKNGKIYIGSAVDLRRRLYVYFN
jgi:hypothetical protein